MAHLAMADGEEMALDDQVAMNRYVGYVTQPDDFEDDDLQGRADGDDLGDGETLAGKTEGAREKGPEGKAGDPKAAPAKRRTSVKGPSNVRPQFARSWNAARSAETAGILGQIHANPHSFVAMKDFSIGNKDENVWGDWTSERAGSAHGELGSGLVGTGRAGGGDAEGTIGLGDVGLVGEARSGEDGDGVRRASGIEYDHRPQRHRKRVRRVPSVRPGQSQDRVRRGRRAWTRRRSAAWSALTSTRCVTATTRGSRAIPVCVDGWRCSSASGRAAGCRHPS